MCDSVEKMAGDEAVVSDYLIMIDASLGEFKQGKLITKTLEELRALEG